VVMKNNQQESFVFSLQHNFMTSTQRFVRRLLLRQTCWLKKDDKNLTRFYTKLNPRVIFRFLGHSVRK
jgi:hypothetical protein